MRCGHRNVAVPRRSVVGLLAAAGAAVLTLTAVAPAGATTDGGAWTRSSGGSLDPGLSLVGDAVERVVVSGVAGGAHAVRRAVEAVGGSVSRDLPIVDGVSAEVPADRLAELAGRPGVGAVTADRRAQFTTLSYDEGTSASSFARSTQAVSAWTAGNTGRGIGVAVIDTGVSQMADFEGRLVQGPDLSGEGTFVDTYGHGTVMAGAIAGSGVDSATNRAGAYTGVAPGAHIVSVKTAGRNGATDVSTLLQAMHWVSAYKDQFNIRVLNLSWGVPSTQDPAVDPLNFAVQRLWKQGIVVVVAAGNSGPNPGTITKPADDPLVLTVGAYDDKGDTNLSNDATVAWSAQGPTAQGLAKPDLVAPGRSLIVSRSFGSAVEAENSKALVSPSYIRGSGTSQAAAVTSGLAALVLAARPSLTPDQVKKVLVASGSPLPSVAPSAQGSGRVMLATALAADPGAPEQQTGTATGLGSIDASRGGRHVQALCDGAPTVIRGEIDVRCEAWDPAAWAGSSWTGSSWTGSSWTGSSWTGSSWTGSSWTGSSWTGSSWTGGTWTGSSWTGSSWTGSSWTGSSWTGSSWTGSSWTSGSYDDVAETDLFLTAWWGGKPRAAQRIAGEPVEDASAMRQRH
jgi:serine protease AprX